VAVDEAGNLYVADSLNDTIRKITPAGTNWVVSFVAGMFGRGGRADGMNGIAQFNQPSGLAVDRSGNLYVADTLNNAIRKITPWGTNWVVSTITGVVRVSGSTNATIPAQFNSPRGVALDRDGNLYVADSGNNVIHRLKPAGTNWMVSDLGGLAGANGATDAAGSDARFYCPYGVVVDNEGHTYYVADCLNNIIRLGGFYSALIGPAGQQVIGAWAGGGTIPTPVIPKSKR
jgi:DNA-binding beta-propeller fold protein YncE